METLINVEGGQINARLEGCGTTLVVLVHELGGSLHSWDAVVPHLAERSRVLRLDMRGFGRSSPSKPDMSIDQAVADLETAISIAGPASRMVLVGNAVGAAVVAAYLLKKEPEGCSAILISPALGVAPERKLVVLDAADKLIANGMAHAVDSELARSYPEELRFMAPQRFLHYRKEFASSHAPSFAAYFRMLYELNLANDIVRLACPVLVLSGSLDPNRPPAEGRMLATLMANASFQEVRSGHFMAYQTPDLFLAAALPFFAQHLFTPC